MAEYHDVGRNNTRQRIAQALAAYKRAETKEKQKAAYVQYVERDIGLLTPSWFLVIWARSVGKDVDAEYLFGPAAVEREVSEHATNVAAALEVRIEALQTALDGTAPAESEALSRKEQRDLLNAYKAVAREYETLFAEAGRNGRADERGRAENQQSFQDLSISKAMDVDASGIGQYVVRVGVGVGVGVGVHADPALFAAERERRRGRGRGCGRRTQGGVGRQGPACRAARARRGARSRPRRRSPPCARRPPRPPPPRSRRRARPSRARAAARRRRRGPRRGAGSW